MGHIHGRSLLRSTGSKDGSGQRAATTEEAYLCPIAPDNSRVKPYHGKHGDKPIESTPGTEL